MDNKKLHDALYSLPITSLLRKEIIWQQKNWPKNSESHALDAWSRYIEKHLELAQQHIMNDREADALEELRIMTAVAIGALMAYETPERE